MTRQVTDNLYIDLGYFTPEEYYTYEANAVANISSQATFVCTADGGAVKDFDVAMSVSASQTTAAVKTVNAVVPFGSAFNSVMVIDALRITEVTLISQAFFVTDFNRNRAVDVTLSNIITQSLQAARTRSTASTLNAAVTQTAQPQTTKDFSASFSASFSQTTGATSTKPFTVQANTAFTQTTIGGRLQTTTLAVNSTFTQAVIYRTFVIGSPVTFRGVGRPIIDDNIKKFGAGSLFLNGSSYLYSPDQATRFNIPDTDTSVDGEFTIEVWFYPTQQPTSQEYFIVGQWQGNSSSTQSWKVELTAGLNVVWTMRIATSTVVTLSGSSNNCVTLNAWNHVAIVRNRNSSTSATTAIWVNGANQSTGTTRNPMWTGASGEMRIGYSGESNSTYFRGYIDAFNFRIGNNRYNPASGTITLPTSEYTTINTTDKILVNFNENYLDSSTQNFVTFTAQLNTVATQTTVALKAVLNSAQLNTVFTQTTIGGNIKQFVANLPTIASQLSAGGKVGDVLVNMPVTVTQNTQAIKTTENISTQNTEFTQTADFARFREGDFAGADAVITITAPAIKTAVFDSTQNTEFTQTTSIDRTRATLVNLNSAFTQTVDADLIVESGLVDFYNESTLTIDADAVRNANILMETLAVKLTVAGYIGDVIVNMNTAATMTVDADSTSGAVVSLNAEFTASATALRIKPLAATINSNSNLAVNADIVTVGASTQQAAFTQSTDIERIRGFILPANSQFTQTAQAVKTTTNTIVTHSEFTQSVDGDKVATGLSLEPVISNLTASAVVVRSAQSQQNSQATLSAQGEVGNIGEASLTSAFTLTATPAKTAQFIVFEPVTAQVAAQGIVIRNTSSQQSVIVTATTSANRLRSSLVSMTAFYSQLTVGSEVNSAQAQLTNAFTMTVDAKLIVLDPELTYRVPKETRSYKIVEELRSYKIIKELRTHEIADN